MSPPYISKISLAAHITNVHSTKKKVEKERTCEHCGKVFKAWQNYKEHVLVKHEKQANYKCDLCDRSYGTINKLKSHKKLVHTHVKCEECRKEISNLFQLRRHKQSVHGISPENSFQCELHLLTFNYVN